MVKKILLGATHSVIEPLGLLHLSTIAKQEGWKPKIALVEKDDFRTLDRIVEDFKPSLLGFTVYTGNHVQVFDYFDNFRKRNKDIKVVLGGPHPTYFPKESLNHADYVVISEGFNSFRKILKNELKPGIIPLTEIEEFPISNRQEFYDDYVSHGHSPIKSIITQTGCQFNCTYCYNSSTLDNIAESLSSEQLKNMRAALRDSNRLFPKSIRPVDDILLEVNDIKRVSPSTQMIYFQDDVFGASIDWMREFAKKYPSIGLPFHAQMRFETADPKNPRCKERVELLRESGCTGLTFAIESADPAIRREVLNRNMSEDLMFNVLSYLNKLGYKVRTEQMLGLPCGATVQPTKINLESDLETLELNVRLKEQTGLPTMAWASIFAPYRGTKIGEYCINKGFYSGGNNDVPETFFERSTLRFPKEWVGPSLSKDNKGEWLSNEEQEIYKNKLQLLRDLFSYFALVPKGHELARKFLNQNNKSFFGLSTETRRHLYDSVLYNLK